MRVLWTDGSASPNPGPGGYAVIEGGEPVALGSDENTTNIRMEGRALIAALKLLDGEPGEIHTDSEFWINTLEVWAPEWKRWGWKKTHGKIKNLELVQELYKLYQNSSAELIWEKGHKGIEMNELADIWANKARKGAKLWKE